MFSFYFSAHFSLEFKTVADSGVIYYADGNYQLDRAYDFEGVFLRNGRLHYFLFNPGDYGTGSSFGFHGSSKKKLNDGKWHTVKVYSICVINKSPVSSFPFRKDKQLFIFFFHEPNTSS